MSDAAIVAHLGVSIFYFSKCIPFSLHKAFNLSNVAYVGAARQISRRFTVANDMFKRTANFVAQVVVIFLYILHFQQKSLAKRTSNFSNTITRYNFNDF